MYTLVVVTVPRFQYICLSSTASTASTAATTETEVTAAPRNVVKQKPTTRTTPGKKKKKEQENEIIVELLICTNCRVPNKPHYIQLLLVLVLHISHLYHRGSDKEYYCSIQLVTKAIIANQVQFPIQNQLFLSR